MVLPQTTLLVRVLKAKLRARAYRIYSDGHRAREATRGWVVASVWNGQDPNTRKILS